MWTFSDAQAGILAECCDYVAATGSGTAQHSDNRDFVVLRQTLRCGAREFDDDGLAILQDAYEYYTRDAGDYPTSLDAEYARACAVIIGDSLDG